MVPCPPLFRQQFHPHLQRRAPALQDTIVSVTSTPTNTKSQDGNKDLGPHGHFESHLCVHAKELLQGTDMKLDLHQIVTFHKSA